MAKKKKTSTGKGFSIKEFFLWHIEKIIFALVLLTASGIAAMGLMAKTYPSTKSPDSMKQLATKVSGAIKENHWEEIQKSRPPIITNFKQASGESRKQISVDKITVFPAPDKSANRRGDPKLSAPIKLQARAFYGLFASPLQKKVDPLEKLEDAKKEEVKPKENKGMRGGGKMGFGETGSDMGYGSGYGAGEGSGMGGMGMGQMGPNAVRFLAPGYDRGFQMGMRTDPMSGMGGMAGMGPMGGGAGYGPPTGPSGPPSGPGSQPGQPGQPNAPPVEIKKPVAVLKGFVVVTALAPHHEMEEEYKKQFADAPGYIEGRDTPNYVGFEVQRAEITDANANSPAEQLQWVDLPKVLTYEQRQYEPPKDPKEKNPMRNFREAARDLIGTCAEVANPMWVDPSITMPILPIVMSDYRKLASHPEVPGLTPEPNEREWEPADTQMGSGYGAGGYGSGYGSGYGTETGSGYGGMETGSMPGGGEGYGAGYGGGAGYGTGYGTETGSEGGYGGGYGSGYGGGYGDGPMGGGGTGPQMSLPKRLPSTKYKLVRFFDTTAAPSKTYRYRVRLLMYDPNFPNYSVFQPRSNTLKTDVVLRVQPLLAQYEPKKDPKAKENAFVKPVWRPSRRETEWSEPSTPVTTLRDRTPAGVYAGFEEGLKTPELVVADLTVALQETGAALYVPVKYAIDNNMIGNVMSLYKKEKGKEAPEVVLPFTKIIKLLKTPKDQSVIVNEYSPKFRITLLDIRGNSRLKQPAAREQPLLSGLEVVTFDHDSGQLFISREFDDFTNFNMFTKPDAPAVGPLGGGLKTEGSGGYGSGYGGAGEEGSMPSGGGGGGKMGGMSTGS